MRKLAVMFLAAAGALFYAGSAGAVFTYVPDAQEASRPSPIIEQNARDALAGTPIQNAAPLQIPKEQVAIPVQQTAIPSPLPDQAINPKVGIGASAPATAAEKAKAEALIRKARAAEGGYAQQPRAVVRQAAKKAPAPVVQQAAAPAAPVYQAPNYQNIQPAYAASALVQGAPPLVIGKGSMREQLIGYANGMGYQVSWNCPDDLIVTNETVFATGTFAGNLRELFETLQNIGRRDMSATLFQGNRTIVIEPARR